MEKLKINVHATFVLFACILVYFGQGLLLICYLVTILLHEYSHAYVAKRLGYNLKNIKLIPFGICLNMHSSIQNPKDEIKIAVAGPAMNFILCIFCLSLWWVFPSSFNYTNLFCYANFVTCFFNFLPAFPLDGGRIMLAILKQKLAEKTAINFCKIINITLATLLIILFVFSCFISLNLTYLFVAFCVLCGVFDISEKNQYFKINYANAKKVGRVVKIKNLYVKNTEKIFKLSKYLDNFSYINLYIYDEFDNLQVIIDEKSFLNLLESTPCAMTFKEVFYDANATF